MPTSPKAVAHKNALKIRLAESVVFLRAGDATGRQRTIQPDAAPGMVRGLLVLTLALAFILRMSMGIYIEWVTGKQISIKSRTTPSFYQFV